MKKGGGYWHTLCVPVRDYWHTPPKMEPMKARVCANYSFLLLAHTLIELRNLEVKAFRGKIRILKLFIKASKISNAKNSDGRGDGIQTKCCNKVRPN